MPILQRRCQKADEDVLCARSFLTRMLERKFHISVHCSWGKPFPYIQRNKEHRRIYLHSKSKYILKLEIKQRRQSFIVLPLSMCKETVLLTSQRYSSNHLPMVLALLLVQVVQPGGKTVSVPGQMFEDHLWLRG